MTDRLLRGARLLGADSRISESTVDLRVIDGRLERIAPMLAAPGAEEVELDGRVVVPGLWDHHVHLGQWAATRRRIDVSSAASAAEVVALVSAAAATDPPAAGSVLIAYGYRDGLWPDRVDLDLLDAVGAPVCVVSADVHAIWSNRAALAVLGRPESDWLVREQPAFDLGGELSAVPDATLDSWVADAVCSAAARGVVGLVDLEMADAGAAWARRRRDPAYPRVRIRAGVYPHDLDAARERGQRTGEPLPRTDGLVEGGPFKLFTDGALGTRTALVDDEYAGIGGRGIAIYAPEQLDAAIRRGLEAGLVPTIHAIGDAAVHLALDAAERTSCGGSIEHAQLVRPEDVPRFAALGVIASVQPEHVLDDRDVSDRYWPGRGDRVIPVRALLDVGASVVFGSDAPVAPLDPWITIAAAVARTRGGREPWHPEQAVTLAEAVAASSRTRIAVGEPADLAILDADPTTADPDALRALPVAGTLLAGEWTHRAL